MIDERGDGLRNRTTDGKSAHAVWSHLERALARSHPRLVLPPLLSTAATAGAVTRRDRSKREVSFLVAQRVNKSEPELAALSFILLHTDIESSKQSYLLAVHRIFRSQEVVWMLCDFTCLDYATSFSNSDENEGQFPRFYHVEVPSFNFCACALAQPFAQYDYTNQHTRMPDQSINTNSRTFALKHINGATTVLYDRDSVCAKFSQTLIPLISTHQHHACKSTA